MRYCFLTVQRGEMSRDARDIIIGTGLGSHESRTNNSLFNY